MSMRKKHVPIVAAVITGTLGIAGIVYQTKYAKSEASVSKKEENNNADNVAKDSGIIINNNNYSSGEKKENNVESVEELTKENDKLKDQLEKAKLNIEELESTQKQTEEDLAQSKTENADITEQLQEANLELKQIKEENKSLTSEVKGANVVDFLDQQIYVEGNKISDTNNSIASIDGKIYYSDEIVEKILGRYGTEYSYTDTEVTIQKDVNATKLPLSQAEVYEKDDCVSTGSGLREDIDGNQFSGILINDQGGISFLVNEKYEKMSGIIHIAKETNKEFHAIIRVVIYDKDGNTKNVFESKELSTLANEQNFTDTGVLDIKGAKVVRIEQERSYGAVDAVISDAFFYNE